MFYMKVLIFILFTTLCVRTIWIFKKNDDDNPHEEFIGLL